MAGLIEDYALIGDMQTAALVGRSGSIDWLCLPRFDSDACFAALLGDEHNGQWRICPTAVEGPVSRRGDVRWQYVGDSLILQTDWETMSGTVRVLDFMPPRADAAPVLVRIVEGLSGAVEMESVLRLRFGYGKIVPWLQRHDDVLRAIAGPDSVCLRSAVHMTGRNMAHEATFTLRAGDRVPFVLSWHPSHLPPSEPIDAEQALAATTDFWSAWSAGCTYHGQYREAVMRSLITLKALTYEPTGGIVAAPTTSLPEDIGGVRNWDYRYCWLRDATITLEALLRTGFSTEADQWRQWLGRAIAGDPRDVQIMYGVAGERRLAEWEADWLPGYEGSAPVRIGNAAVQQRQLDVYGEVVEKGFNAERGAFTQYYGSQTLDASVLLMAGTGFLPPDDPKLVATVEAISRDLVTDGLVRRYQLSAGGESAVDGLPGSEGAFLACSFWLVDNYTLMGRRQEAMRLFNRLRRLANNVGLYAEEYDPDERRMLGNFPQAFSHVALINTALNLMMTEKKTKRIRSGAGRH